MDVCTYACMHVCVYEFEKLVQYWMREHPWSDVCVRMYVCIQHANTYMCVCMYIFTPARGSFHASFSLVVGYTYSFGIYVVIRAHTNVHMHWTNMHACIEFAQQGAASTRPFLTHIRLEYTYIHSIHVCITPLPSRVSTARGCFHASFSYTYTRMQ